MTDDLDHLLKPRPGPTLSDAVFEQTARTIRRRARIRLTMKATGLAALVVSGFVLGWLAKPAAVRVESNPPDRVESQEQKPIPHETSEYADLTPDQLEQKAELSDDSKLVARFYKLAGDAYLARRRYDEAMRCYTLHIAAGKDTEIHRDDSWLLCSVKSTHSK